MERMNFNNMNLGIKEQTEKHLGKCEGCEKEVYQHYILYESGREVNREFGCICEKIKEASKEYLENKMKDYERYSVIADEYKTKTVEEYKPRNESQKYALGVVKSFIKKRETALEKGKGMILMGGFGTGKTHLASAIRNVLAEDNKSVLFISFPDYLDIVKQGFGNNGQADQRYAQKSYKTQELAKNADLLILDDIGANNMTAWSKEQLFMLINARIGKSTITTTNLTIEDFQRDEQMYRSFSRMSEKSPIVEVKGDDLRRIDGSFSFD